MKRVLQSYYSGKEMEGKTLFRFEIIRDLETKLLETMFLYGEKGKNYNANLPFKEFCELWDINPSKLLDIQE